MEGRTLMMVLERKTENEAERERESEGRLKREGQSEAGWKVC